MNDEQFEGRMQIVEVEVSQMMANQLRARDTAQREALARVEAELNAKPADDLAQACIAQLIESGAENYTEHHFGFVRDGEDVERPAVVTVQFSDRPSPHELRIKAEAERDTAQAQLAEMRRIVAGFLFNYDDGVGEPWERRLLDYARKLVDAKEFNAQAEQQEARNAEVVLESLRHENRRIEPIQPLCNPRSAKFQAALEETFRKFESMSDEELEAVVAAHMPQQEAQGAQAGDERAAFEHWASDGGLYPKALERGGNHYKLAQTHSYWQAWQARAALATQPAANPLPAEISLHLMGTIVDEVFDGGIEDASVISDIYRVMARECNAAVRGTEQ